MAPMAGCWCVYSVSVALAALLLLGEASAAGLQFDFYDRTCPDLEDICMEVMQDAIDEDVGNAAGMLRLWFHDCFVGGCDGSVLLDPVSGKPPTEKEARPNSSLKGFEIVDRAKTRVLEECPGALISCTDITLLLARNAVFLTGGPFWDVTLGRRDGTTSFASKTSSLPSPFDNLKGITDKFTFWGLSQTDMVVLSGAHTIGFAHCNAVQSRLYNASGGAQTDPTMSKSLAKNLRKRCPQPFYNRAKPAAGSFLDLSSQNQFDNRYFSNLQQSFGVLASDQLLYVSNRTRRLVDQLAGNQPIFFNNFIQSMVKMSSAGVKTGIQGEIRLNCRVVNAPSAPPPTKAQAPPPVQAPPPPPVSPPTDAASAPPVAPPPDAAAAAPVAPPPDAAAAAPVAPPPDAVAPAPVAPPTDTAAAPVAPPPDTASGPVAPPPDTPLPPA